MKFNKTKTVFQSLSNDEEGNIVLKPMGEIENKPARSRVLMAEVERLEGELSKAKNLIAESAPLVWVEKGDTRSAVEWERRALDFIAGGRM